MAETLVLAAPEVHTVTQYSVQTLLLAVDTPLLRAVLVDENGVRSSYEYTGPLALSLIIQLNKADLSTISLNKRILQRLVVDGKLPTGTVTGTPD